MKKVFFICSLIFSSIAVNAQLYLGGSLGFNTSVSKNGSSESTSSGLTFAPELGYSLNDKFDIGGAISFSNTDNGSSV